MMMMMMILMMMMMMTTTTTMTMTFKEAYNTYNFLKRTLDISVAKVITSCRISGSVMLGLYDRQKKVPLLISECVHLLYLLRKLIERNSQKQDCQIPSGKLLCGSRSNTLFCTCMVFLSDIISPECHATYDYHLV